MKHDKLLYRIALTRVRGVGDITARHLMDVVGDEEAIFTESTANLKRVFGVTDRLASELKNPQVLVEAEKELTFVLKNHITPLFYTDPDYPSRLKECADAPILLFAKGDMNLNASKIVSIVGTRNCTEYGKDLTEMLLIGLAEHYPDILIVSGLAYGIDIVAHRAAVRLGLPTVGVLAHGLDRIYPSVHRKTAIEMLSNGGLLTDFPSGTNPDRQNFVKRNRIVAGIADATIVVESSIKGGSLITGELAASYGRDVFSFPGRVYDQYSAGCVRLIQQNKAAMITSHTDLIEMMRWDITTKVMTPKQQEICFDYSPEEQIIVDFLSLCESSHLNIMSLKLGIPVYKLSSQLFEMEMKGYVKCLPGGSYALKRV